MDFNHSDSREFASAFQALIVAIDVLTRAAGIHNQEVCKDVVMKAFEDAWSTNNKGKRSTSNINKFPFVGKNDGVEVLINDGEPDTGTRNAAHSMATFTDTSHFVGKGNGVEILVNDCDHEMKKSSYAVFTDYDHFLPNSEKSGEDAFFDSHRLIGRKFSESACELIVNDTNEGVINYPHLPLAENVTEFDTRRLIGRKFGSSDSGYCDGKNDGVELTAYDDGDVVKCCSLAFSDVEHLLGERDKDPETIDPTKFGKSIGRTHSTVSHGSTMTEVSVDTGTGNETAEEGLHDPGSGVCGFSDLHPKFSVMVNNNAHHWSGTASNVQIAVPCA